jgi:hypothetical protein
VKYIKPCLSLLFLAISPFLVFWRLWTHNLLDRGFLYNDVSLWAYPTLMFLVDSIKQFGEIPLWSWGIYSGIPVHGSLFNQLFYPLNLVFYFSSLDPASTSVFHCYILLHVSIGAVAFFLLARSFEFETATSLLGAVVYTFSGYMNFILMAGNAFAIPHAWLPVAALFIRKLVLRGKPAWALLAGVAFALMLGSVSPLSVIPVFYFLPLFCIASVFIEKKGKHIVVLSIWFLAGLAFAFSLVAAQILPMLELSAIIPKESVSQYTFTRDKWFDATTYLFIRDYFLGTEGYLDAIVRAPMVYLGAVGGLMALLGIWSRYGKYYLFWVSSFLVLVFMFFAGKDFVLYDLFYHFVPMAKILSSPARAFGSVFMFVGSFLIMTGLCYGIGLLRSSPKPSNYCKPASIVVFIIALFLWLIYKPEDPRKASYFLTNMYLPWILPISLILLLLSSIRKKKHLSLGIALILCIFAVDTLSFVQRNFEHRYLSRQKILDTENNVLRTTNSPYIFGRSDELKLPSINKPRINVKRNMVSLVQGRDNVAGYYRMLPWRTVQSFVASGFEDEYLFLGPQPETLEMETKWRKQATEKLFHLDDGLKGRAWLVSEIINCDSPPFNEVAKKDFDPYSKIFIESEKKVINKQFGKIYGWLSGFIDAILTPDRRDIPKVSQQVIPINNDLSLLRQTVNTISFRLERDVNKEAFFFSDNWYPGWVAYVNGKRVPIYVANYSFKGILLDNVVRATTIEFVFDPPIVKVGYAITIFSILVIVVLVWKHPGFRLETGIF